MLTSVVVVIVALSAVVGGALLYALRRIRCAQTESWEVQHALRESEEQHRKLFETMRQAPPSPCLTPREPHQGFPPPSPGSPYRTLVDGPMYAAQPREYRSFTLTSRSEPPPRRDVDTKS